MIRGMILILAHCSARPWWLSLVWVLAAVATAAAPTVANLPPIGMRFNSPDDAVHALVRAAQSRDTNAVHEIFGPAARELVSPDLVQAAQEYEIFTRRLGERVDPVHQSSSRIELRLGLDGWPFPIPLIGKDG